MAMTINTNVVSINSQRNLSLSGNSLGTTMQRLSSGLRVNSAKDDAAGLAIAERMNAQSKGLAVAARNANDGISLAQTAEGALGKVGDMLQRMRELAVQASNATNSADDRKALQAEVSQLTAEIDRVAKTSSFNGKNLLDGSFAGGVFQVGAGAGDNITVGGITNAKAEALGKSDFATVDLGKADGTVKGIAAKDIKATAVQPDLTKNESGIKIQVGGGSAVDIGALEAASSGDERLGQVVAAINAKTADTGVTAFLSKNSDDTYRLEVMSNAMKADGTAAEKVTITGLNTLLTDDAAAGSDGAKAAFTSTVTVAATSETGINKLSVETQAGAWKALETIDSAIDQVNSARANLGALQTRFEKAIENIDIQNENISAARGRIVDADFATETANLSRAQILQQAGTAMVAQANQLPQGVLSLLQ
ncbi:flagellin [Comamonas aquatica]|uniref:Flagellin n=1 Tax=Comamonas aquatica TaxID=225991 RepID=A0AA43AYW5_9BURK|nr:flagellin [Comamonas aquatica]MDH1427104.1 flagellin [Comamonas aquatica]MDH1607152.1 flagellin [Comamonas aquatica]MDH1618973.1 flagellin [Comamonas aquatica]MDH2006941.1 flagellin [Comamonas aquatica]